MSCQLNGTSPDLPECCSSEGSSFQDKGFSGYSLPNCASGWMYYNAQDQLCGPYYQEQLYEGLSTGFLPDELFVYPVINGTKLSPVPLKYFKQFPEHVATGFAYFSVDISNMGINAAHSNPSTNDLAVHRQEGLVEYADPQTLCHELQSGSPSLKYGNGDCKQASHSRASYITTNLPPVGNHCLLTTSENYTEHPCFLKYLKLCLFSKLFCFFQSVEGTCWLYEDQTGRKHGPHSLVELYSWHQHGYLKDSVMVICLHKSYICAHCA